MKVLIRQLGCKHETVEEAEDALAGISAWDDCVFGYVDVEEKRPVVFFIPNEFPHGVPDVETVEAGSDPHPHRRLYRGQRYVLVRHDNNPPTGEDRLRVKII